jgi:hypothetical protein
MGSDREGPSKFQSVELELRCTTFRSGVKVAARVMQDAKPLKAWRSARSMMLGNAFPKRYAGIDEMGEESMENEESMSLDLMLLQINVFW